MASWSVLGLLCLIMMVLLSLQNGNAFQFTVGGAKGWTVPNNSSGFNYNSWAESNRFSVGDSLLFVYDPAEDSVLEVSKGDYDHCSTASPIGTYSDGHSVYKFNHSGAHYFISGYKGSCLQNEKVVIVVLADRTSNPTTTAPPPSPPPAIQHSPPDESPYGDSPNNNGAIMAGGFIGSVLGAAFLSSFMGFFTF